VTIPVLRQHAHDRFLYRSVSSKAGPRGVAEAIEFPRDGHALLEQLDDERSTYERRQIAGVLPR
jgi:hypothetical protein